MFSDPCWHIATSDERMSDILLHYFQSLFTTDDINLSFIQYMDVKTLSLNHTLLLQADITDTEILQTVKQLSPWKALGPDGLHAGFFRDNQHLIYDDVTCLIHKYLSGQYSWECINSTHLVLIPKVKNPI